MVNERNSSISLFIEYHNIYIHQQDVEENISVSEYIIKITFV